MKGKMLKIKNAKMLSKKQQKRIIGGLIPVGSGSGSGSGGGSGNGGGDGSTECLYTGCFPSDGFPSFVGIEGGPCALETPDAQVCVGTVINDQCCGGFF